MLSCPNKNTKDWKDLVEKIGEVEAFRDYIETDGEIRSAEDILKEKQINC